MRTLELTGGRTDATRLLVANRVQRRAKTARAARSTQVKVRTYVTLTTVQFVGSADLAAWEQSLEPRLLVHVVREEPAVTVVDAPVGTETLTIDGARVNLLPASAVNVLRTQTWDWTDGVGRWDWTVGAVDDDLGFVFVSGLGIARETVTQGSFVSVVLDAYLSGRARWLEVLQTRGENE